MDKKRYVIVISITPFDNEGRLDEAAFRAHLRRLGDAGVSVYVGGSGSGEGYALSFEERERVFALAVEELKGKVPIAAMGCEPHLPGEMVEFLRRAEYNKLDFAQVFSLHMGHSAIPTARELENYYSSVLGSSSIPVYLSSHYTAGYFLPIDLIEKLVSRFPTIAGVAYGGPDVTYLDELVRRVGERVDVVCAGPANGVSVLALGGNGFMGGEGNFSPQLVAAVISAFETRDMEGLREAFSKLMAFAAIQKRYGGSSMRAMKPLLNAYGLPGGTLRPPRLPITAEELEGVLKQTVELALPGLPPAPAEA
jgi:dihydrodipicolinate synthase/N-acetylneuraminate lyase